MRFRGGLHPRPPPYATPFINANAAAACVRSRRENRERRERTEKRNARHACGGFPNASPAVSAAKPAVFPSASAVQHARRGLSGTLPYPPPGTRRAHRTSCSPRELLYRFCDQPRARNRVRGGVVGSRAVSAAPACPPQNSSRLVLRQCENRAYGPRWRGGPRVLLPPCGSRRRPRIKVIYT